MTIKKVKTLADITPATKGVVQLKRGKDILELPVKGITLEAQQAIEEKYSLPSPPKQYKKLPGMASPELIESPDDPKYLEEVKKLQQGSTREIILAGIDLTIDGETPEEKWKSFVSTGLSVGDFEQITKKVLELSNMTEIDVKRYVDFFE